MTAIADAIFLVFQPSVLVTIVIAAIFGLVVGAIPGLTATMAVALLVSVTFFMDPVPAVGAMVTCSAMAIFAGDIPGTLLRIPGTPASAAYTDECYAMTLRGEGEIALGANLLFSVLGGLFGTFVLIVAAPALAEFALMFSSFEFFWLAALGLTSAALIGSGSPVRGAIALFLGLFFSTIGSNNPSNTPRFSFGSIDLAGGIEFIPAMIGLFALSVVIRWAIERGQTTPQIQRSFGNIFRNWGDMFVTYWRNQIRGNVTGVAIGILPGAGADVAAWVSYAISKRASKHPEKYGTGHVEGIIESTSANNSSLAGAWVPALVFGIPGDTITAIVIGVLYMKGLNPGPTIFIDNPQFLYAIFIIFIIANLLMLPLGWVAIKAAKTLLRTPRDILMPAILLFCIVGSFAINNSMFGVLLMLAFGILGFIMEENGIPVAPCVLALVLGPIIEEQFVTSMIKSRGSFLTFFERPIAGALGALTLAIWLWPLFSQLTAFHRRHRDTASGAERNK